MICPHCGMDTEVSVVKYDYRTVVEDMNRILGTKYKFTDKLKTLITARYREGFTTEDFATVCRNMKAAWGADPNMAQYLRPITLFGTKFDTYLNRVQPEQAKVNNGLAEGMVW